MGIRLRSNITSLTAQRHFRLNTERKAEAMAKLSSGKRINRASDDAAGLAISERVQADIVSLKQAQRNANDGISMVQTAEGGLIEAGNIVVRLRELAVQAATDTISSRERSYLDGEILQLKAEIDRVSRSTHFNGTTLLAGENQTRSNFDVGSNKFPLEVQVGSSYFQENDGPEKEDPLNIIRLDFAKINAQAVGDKSLNLGLGEQGVRVHTKEAAQNSINVLDAAITKINSHRAFLGAVQNRLNAASHNLGIQIEDLSTAVSRIRDTDFGQATAELVQANILEQAGASILATANSMPKIALALLQQNMQ